METYLAAAYWGPRKESIEACAVRAENFFASLEFTSDLLKGWRRQGVRKSTASKTSPESLTTESLLGLLSSGRNRRDGDGSSIDNLGYRISLWNGGDTTTAASIMITCGLYAGTVGLSNAAVLRLPVKFDIFSRNCAEALMRNFILAWDPDWVVLASSSNLARIDTGPFLDQGVYIRASMYSEFVAPQKAIVRKLENGVLYLRADQGLI
ncbi:Imm52 family immunity protein [Herbaspirillum lusitanum]|uniref:Imm52 family immunity protein n=1 Tax=Herbaspirillum lusitanum TaxID=213312 RepID=UPI0012F48C5E|nr:Imm52 family immunity protein [Herbaspirillum lusitanum]